MSDIIKAIPCPRCKQLFSENQDCCPNCGYRTVTESVYQKYLIKQDIFLSLIIYSNLAIFIISVLWTFFSGFGIATDFFGFPIPSIQILEKLGALYTVAIFKGELYRIMNYLFLHGNLLHLILNMFWIYILRAQLKEFPAKIIFLIYFAGGISGGIAAFLLERNAIIVGASGAVFGLLGAILAYARKRKDIIGFLLWKQFSFLALVIILFGFLLPNVSNAGHLGGIAGGFLFTWFVVLGNLSLKNTIFRILSFLFYAAIGSGVWQIFFPVKKRIFCNIENPKYFF